MYLLSLTHSFHAVIPNSAVVKLKTDHQCVMVMDYKNDEKGLAVLSMSTSIPLLSRITVHHTFIYYPFHLCLSMLYHDIYVVINLEQPPSRPLYLQADLTPITV